MHHYLVCGNNAAYTDGGLSEGTVPAWTDASINYMPRTTLGQVTIGLCVREYQLQARAGTSINYSYPELLLGWQAGQTGVLINTI